MTARLGQFLHHGCRSTRDTRGATRYYREQNTRTPAAYAATDSDGTEKPQLLRVGSKGNRALARVAKSREIHEKEQQPPRSEEIAIEGKQR